MLKFIYVVKIPVFFYLGNEVSLTHVNLVFILVLICSGLILMNVAQRAVKRTPVAKLTRMTMMNLESLVVMNWISSGCPQNQNVVMMIWKTVWLIVMMMSAAMAGASQLL